MNIVVLISGGGTTMERVIRACQGGEIDGNVVHVIASNGSAGGLAKAAALGVPTTVLKLHRDFGGNNEAFGQAILAICQKAKADLIAQLGWLAPTPANVIAAFLDIIFNQHCGPLDPGHLSFGGPGMYGRTVHEAVIRFARLVNRPFLTEATVHRVTQEYDNGTLLGTRALKILKDDTAETLAKRLLPIEHELVVETIARFVSGQIVEMQRTRPLILPDEEELFHQAVAFAKSQTSH